MKKKKVLQKVLTAGLIGAMALGTLAGCGTKQGDAAATLGIDTKGKAGIDGWKAFEKNVTLTVPVYDRGREGVPNVTDNYWTKWIQKEFGDKYNITVKFEPIPRSEVLATYTNLGAVGELPTILMEYDYPKLAQWAGDGYLREYNIDEFKHVAPTYYERMVSLDQIKYTELNGKRYFALAERPYYNTNYTFVTWYRLDWLKKVGYDHVPATRAEYLDAMKKIMDQGIAAHPGGGTMILSGQGADQNYGYRTYPQNEEEWAVYGDYNIPSLGWEPNKRLLQFANEDYNLGITDPEYYTIDAQTSEANFINGKNYSYSAYISASMPVLESFYKQNPGAELALGVQALEADTAANTAPASRADNPFGMMIGFSSQASKEEVQAAWMYMEWMTQTDNLFTMQWGVEGKTYNMVDGKPVFVAYEEQPIDVKQGFSNSKDYWCVTIEAVNYGSIEEIISASSPKGLPQDFTQDLIQNYKNKVAVISKGWIPSDCLFAVDMKQTTEYQGTLQSKYVEFRDKLVVCKPAEFDALYKQYTDEYNAAGYKAVTDERREAYKNGMCSKLK